MSRFGFEVADNSGHWYFLKVIYQDGEKKIYNKAFKTYEEAQTVIYEYFGRLKDIQFIIEKTEETRTPAQETKVEKDADRSLQVVGAYTTILGTPIGIGLGVYSALTQNKRSDQTTKMIDDDKCWENDFRPKRKVRRKRVRILNEYRDLIPISDEDGDGDGGGF